MQDHNLTEDFQPQGIRYEERPVYDRGGKPVDDLHIVWITLDNQRELNSYTTETIKEVILAFRQASSDRAAVAVVFTGAGDRAFCTGGNTREYAEVYAGNPGEYRQYMRLFNDMVSAILHCDKPVICRVNGMRVGGGQEIGMACDFSIASDLAVFSQAGPKHGSAPDGGSTDFLPLFVGIENAMYSGTLCEPWSAHRFYYLGGLTDILPALKVDGEWIANPLVITDRYVDDGEIVYGEMKTGEAAKAARDLIKNNPKDLSRLDAAVDEIIWRLTNLFPGCLMKSIDGIRAKKKFFWDQMKLANRHWLAANMSVEAFLGFTAFNTKKITGQDVIDFVRYRQLVAEGAMMDDAAFEQVLGKPAR